MQALIDHIAAVVIGATVLLIIMAVTIRTQDNSIATVQAELAKSELRVIVDLLEQDIMNMGSGGIRQNSDTANRVIEQFALNGDDTVLRFYGLASPGAGLATTTFEWRFRNEGEIAFSDGVVIDAFEVERTVAGQTVTFENVADFNITLRDGNLQPVPLGASADDLAFVRFVEVELGVVSPAGPDDILQQTRWTKRFRPVAMDGPRQIIFAPPY
jgi:hypothetical protein